MTYRIPSAPLRPSGRMGCGGNTEAMEAAMRRNAPAAVPAAAGPVTATLALTASGSFGERRRLTG
jgi:hypothetical protein